LLAKRPSSERALFFSLWLILILLFGIYKFRPRELAQVPNEPPVKVAIDLDGLLGKHRYIRITPSEYELEFVVPAEYRARVGGDPKTLQLSYQLMSESGVLSSGVAPCVIHSKENTSRVVLRNPQRVSPKSVQIFLAH